MTAAICAGESPSHSASSRTSRSTAEAMKRLVHERLLLLIGGGRLRSRRRLECQPFLQREAAASRPPLVCDHTAGRRVQPHARGIALGHLVQTAPGRQEHLRNGILRVARAGPPAAVRDYVRAVRGKQGIEATPSLTFGVRYACGSHWNESCPAASRSFDRGLTSSSRARSVPARQTDRARPTARGGRRRSRTRARRAHRTAVPSR